MPGAPPTRRFIRVTACALLRSCPVPSWPLPPTTLSFGACLRLFFFLCRFQLLSSWTPHRREHLSMRKHNTRDSVGLLLSTLSCHQAIFLSSLSSSTWGWQVFHLNLCFLFSELWNVSAFFFYAISNLEYLNLLINVELFIVLPCEKHLSWFSLVPKRFLYYIVYRINLFQMSARSIFNLNIAFLYSTSFYMFHKNEQRFNLCHKCDIVLVLQNCILLPMALHCSFLCLFCTWVSVCWCLRREAAACLTNIFAICTQLSLRSVSRLRLPFRH